jgi:integrase/recombinase XerD
VIFTALSLIVDILSSQLQNGVDRAVIALWLGHESVETTYIYLHADLELKEQAMAKTSPPRLRPNRYRPDDAVLSFLNSL